MNAGLLGAGAVLPVGTDVEDAERRGLRCDAVTARWYRHPGLGDRVVVRLVGDRIGAGEDTALACFGFSPPERSVPVGVARRGGLRFPESVLVDDPEHAAEALGAVPELRKITKLAKQKPGHAKDSMNRLAGGFSQRLPHFLPGIYEYMARVFVEVGADSLAASAFDAARAAERAHALPVDETARRDAYLEFALAGAVSAKTLTAYSKDLARDHDAATAYAEFRDLCVRRTFGGLSPWSDMLKVLSRMAKAAKLDVTDETRALAATLLDAPAFVNAPAKVLEGFVPALTSLGRRSPEARATMAWLFPSANGSASFRQTWIDLLCEIGVVTELAETGTVSGGAAAEVGPAPGDAAPDAPGEAARWTLALIEYLNRGDGGAIARYVAVAERLADRLRADGEPLRFRARSALEAELVDALLASGIAVAGEFHVTLTSWLKAKPDQRRDLVAITTHPDHRAKLVSAVRASLGNGVEAFADVPVVRDIVDGWLAERVRSLATRGLIETSNEIRVLSRATAPGTFDERPTEYAELTGFDLAEAVAKTLRTGLLDEFGWPALEEAIAQLGEGVKYTLAWPNMVVYNGTTALVAGRDKVVAEYSLREPENCGRITALLAAERDLLVEWSDRSGGYRSYWTSSQADTFRTNLPGSMAGVALPVPGGGRTDGGRALMPGDTTFACADVTAVFSDGDGYWRLRHDSDRPEGERSWVERFDPVTGDVLQVSRPEFLTPRRRELGGDGEATLQDEECWLGSLGPDHDPTGSVLGVRDGLVGFRVWSAEREDGPAGRYRVVAESIDGRRFAGWLPAVPRWLLSMPGDDAPRPVVLSAGKVEIMDPTGTFASSRRSVGGRDWLDHRNGLAAPSLGYLPPPRFWHNLSARDLQGSAALRAVTATAARGLIDAAVADLVAEEAERGKPTDPSVPVVDSPRTRTALARQLPAITHEGLLRGVLDLLRYAGQIQRGLTELVTTREPGYQPPATEPVPQAENARWAALSDEAIGTAMLGLEPSGNSYFYGSYQVGTLIANVLDFLTGRRDDLPDTAERRGQTHWPILLCHPGAIAARAAAPVIDDAQREALLGLLALWAENSPPGIDEYQIGWSFGNDQNHGGHPCGGFQTESGRYVHLRLGWNGCCVIAGPGVHPPRCGTAITPWPAPRIDRAWISSFTTLLRERGPVVWSQEAVGALAERTGLTRQEATLIWATFPRFEDYARDFLGAGARAALGLKSTEAQTAREPLKAVSRESRLAICDAMVPADPADLWEPLGGGPDDDGSVVARLASAWIAATGRAVEVAWSSVEESKIAAGQAPRLGMLRALAAPELVPALTTPTRLRVLPNGEISGDEPWIISDTLIEFARYLAWAGTALAVGDPLRAKVATALGLIRERLADPGLFIDLGTIWDTSRGADPLVGFGDVAFQPAGSNDPEFATSRDTGSFVVFSHGHRLSVLCRPARLEPGPLYDMVASRIGKRVALIALDLLCSRGYSAIAERATLTPVPVGGYEANPTLSAPELVTEVSQTLGVSPDAAALYLQLLALVAPTDRAIKLWNEWRPARHKAAIAELRDASLVVAAIRPRAGRSVFVPGGWAEAASPEIPVESWKLPLYGCEVLDGKVRAPLGRVLPPRPIHELFAAAWRRVQEGDRP